MKMHLLKSAMALAIAAGLTPGAASALTFNFTVGGPVTGAGTLTTSDTVNMNGSYLITGIAGTFEGANITALLAPGGLGANDNLLFPNANPQLDFNGFSFSTTDNNYNIFYNANVSSYRLITQLGAAGNRSITFAATAADGAVPEPATWGMLVLGFGAMGQALRRRKSVTARIRFA